MKKFLFFIMSLFTATAVVAQEGPDAKGYYHVASAEQLYNLLSKNAKANVILTEDIYMSDLGLGESGCHVLCDTFYGILDGDGHTIWAASPEVQHDGGGHYHRQYLFNNCDWVIIRNLTFKNFRVQSESVPNQAIITSKAFNNCRFENITLDHVSIFGDEDNVGAVAGWSDDCTFENITVKNSDFTTDASQSGAIVGHALYCIFKDIKVENCESTADNGKAGGIAGRSDNSVFNGVDVSGGEIEGYDEYVGGVCGYATSCEFNSCLNSATVKANNDHIGGIVGYCEGTNFTRCSNSGTVYPTEDDQTKLGGIVGYAENGTIEFCSNYGSFGAADYCGGIAGWAEKVTFSNCLCSTRPGDDIPVDFFTWKFAAGAIVGYNKSCKVINNISTGGFACLSNADYSVDMDPASGNNFFLFQHGVGNDNDKHTSNVYQADLSFREVVGGLAAYRLNNSRENLAAGIKPWRQVVGKEIPSLDPEKPEVTMDNMKQVYWKEWEWQVPNVVRVSSPQDLKYFADCVNSSALLNTMCVLETDIDLASTEFENWIPIGTKDLPFCGLFDGNGHTIKGFNVKNDYAAGLFGYVGASAIIENVTLIDCEIVCNGEEGAGGIVGQYNLGGRLWGDILIRNCGTSVSVTAPKHAGGIFGRFVPKTINDDYSHNDRVKMRVYNCYSIGTVTATSGGNSGLLCGYTRNTADVKNCWSVGKLLAGTSAKPYDTQHNEFFVGYMDRADISGCYAMDPSVSVQHATSGLTQNGVTNLSEAAVESGEIVYRFNKSCGNTVLQQNIGTNPYPVPGNKGLYHTRKVSNQYGTVCLPFYLKSDDKISYYKFSEATEGSDIKLKFTFTEEVIPGTPVLFRAVEAKDANVSEPVEICLNNAGDEFYNYPNGPLYPIWDMIGTFERKVFEGEDSKSIYYVSGGEIKNAKKTTIDAYRAYIVGPSINELGAKNITFSLEDEDGSVTALRYDIENDTLRYDNENGKAYTIMGTEAPAGYKGIVIKNGKKTLSPALSR